MSDLWNLARRGPHAAAALIYPTPLADDHFWVASFGAVDLSLVQVEGDYAQHRVAAQHGVAKEFLRYVPDGPVEADGWALDALSRRQGLQATPMGSWVVASASEARVALGAIADTLALFAVA